ncbi:SMODS-associated NUDIX domain-containing protein [Kutzneria sp. CA-103260]|uniref:SMODS-associated NUDIX domain-containing protein n=1 Tax=Kutzneria sp. CA-103260 TaxID=2802641 RepID=UPI001BA99869|nr:hypothetical protein [Kutzneria sp. CA-103260]QUQ62843.1 SMODS-associated NUDIX domain protein [Kutzneria sp. CA-103260]
MFWQRRARPVRVCFAAVLRIRPEQTEGDDRIVLVESHSRPGAFAPPGGVFRHDGPEALRRLGFAGDHDHHLRGFLPARSIDGFVRWFDSGAGREDGAACLRRSMAEVLAEFGVPGQNLSFDRMSTEIECSGQELRGFEFHDLVGTSPARDRILALAEDSRVHTVLSATAEDVANGHVGAAVIAPHTAYLTSRAPSLR